jgi:hypothetical protein
MGVIVSEAAHGIGHYYWSECRVEQLRKLVDRGLSIGQIGRLMGISRGAVASKVRALGLRLVRSKSK